MPLNYSGGIVHTGTDHNSAAHGVSTQQNFEDIKKMFPIKTQDIANNAVGTNQIAAGAVTTAKYAATPIQSGGSLGVGSFDGQLAYYLADSTNGVVWTFRYRAASASASKWEFVGGPPLDARVDTQEATASTTYVNLTTTGPTLTAPLAGDYVVSIGCEAINSATSFTIMSYAIGAATAAEADRALFLSAVANQQMNLWRAKRQNTIAAATAFTAKYRVTGATGNFLNRSIQLFPVRVT